MSKIEEYFDNIKTEAPAKLEQMKENIKLKNFLKKTWLGEKVYIKIPKPIWLSYRLPKARKLMSEYGYDILQQQSSS